MENMDKILELENIVNSIEGGNGPKPNRPSWAFSSENLDKEMNSVPLFMKNLPEDAEENVALAALQTLKFDGTPEENAKNFKELGNECFAQGKASYKDAIQYFTQALDQYSKDDQLNVICYINRAAVNLELGNYRMVLTDCSKALGIDNKNVKACYRSAKALYYLERVNEAKDCCEFGLNIDPENAPLKKLLEQIISLKNKLDEKERVKKEKEEAEALRIKELQDALKQHTNSSHQASNIRFVDSNDKLYQPDLKADNSVTYDRESQQLIWPVFFLYPEYKESDFIEKYYENNTFKDHLEVMFEQPAPWDDQNNPKYTVENIEIYFESFPSNATKPKLFKVGKGLTLNKVLASNNYLVVNGTPSFILLAKGSSFKDEFLNRYKD
ncbi:TPR-like protein [Neoconidiobolus thromboides FSU 785]|nr:TPR-like protein [Neoconidiobolus thromboides FSU 785]